MPGIHCSLQLQLSNDRSNDLADYWQSLAPAPVEDTTLTFGINVSGTESDSAAAASSSATAGPARKRPRFTRSTAGCFGCRKQKVKCDETRPTCLKCIAAERECTWPPEGGRKRRKRGTGKLGSEVKEEAEEAGGDGAVFAGKPGAARRQSAAQSQRGKTEEHSSGEEGSSGEEDAEDATDAAAMGSSEAVPAPPPTTLSAFASNGDLGSFSGMAGQWDFPHGLLNGASSSMTDDVPGGVYASAGLLDASPASNHLDSQISTFAFTPSQQPNTLAHQLPSPSLANHTPHPMSLFSFDPARTGPHAGPSSNQSQGQGTVAPEQLLLPRARYGAASGPAFGTNNATNSAVAISPPQVIDIGKSHLLAKRKDKARNTGPSMQSVHSTTAAPEISTSQLRIAMVDMILQAFSFDEGLFEFGPSHRTRNMINSFVSTPVNTDFLSLAFPSPAARLLFHHYCNTTSRLLITMGNVGPNPLLALCTPLKLLDTASAWAGAIRMSILSISATHFAHETQSSVGRELLGNEWEGKRARLKELSGKFKKAALCNVYLGTAGDDPQQIDSILAACTLLCIRDVIDAEETWQDNLDFAIHLIAKRGGPLAMLNAPDSSFTRRYLLENLAVHDVFGCFITGKEPALLGNFDPWWFDSVDSSTTRWEWESVEQTFGISRTVVDLLARVAALDSRKRRLDINLSRNPEEMGDVGQYLYRESQNLMFELDILGNSLSALPQHVRVTCGDYIYKYTAAVYVLADILEEPTTSPRIVRDVASILELCSEASAMRMSVMLIWPLLIAGVFCLPDMRPKVEELFAVFEPYYAEDLPVARDLVREQWRGMDEGLGKRSWRDVMRKLGKYVLLI